MSDTQDAMAVAHNASPAISVYPWGQGFGSKFADPAGRPAREDSVLDILVNSKSHQIHALLGRSMNGLATVPFYECSYHACLSVESWIREHGFDIWVGQNSQGIVTVIVKRDKDCIKLTGTERESMICDAALMMVDKGMVKA